MKLELSIHALKLKNVAGAFKGTSDPFACVTLLAQQPGDKPVVLGKTETIKNTLSPQWVKTFIFDYDLGAPQKLAISIFDEITKGDNKSMGSAVFEVGELLGARGNTKAKKLQKSGTIFASVRKAEGGGLFRLQLAGQKLRNVEGGLFNKSDPFFELSRKIDSAGGLTWDNVFRSNVVKNNLNPTFEVAVVELSTLCGGNLDAPILISLYDFESSGKHVSMGSCESTVNALVKAAQSGEAFRLMNKGKDSGTLKVLKAEATGVQQQGQQPVQQGMNAPHPTMVSNVTQGMAATHIGAVPAATAPYVPSTASSRPAGPYVPSAPPAYPAGPYVPPATSNYSAGPYVPSASSGRPAGPGSYDFVDYISGGCQLNVVVAIDFTGSNGDPRVPGTLHYIGNPSQRNDYERAMAAIVSILAEYDYDKKFPVLGFGAKYHGVVNHCFQCGPTAEANGVAGVLQAYRSVFSSGLIMSGPTVVTEVMQTAAARATSAQDAARARGQQAYTVLIILTDGAVTDIQATARCLEEIQEAPLSIVIVGLGNADFTSMQFLDDAVTRPGQRDIAQFVEFNKHCHSSIALTRETLNEIPKQLSGYFQKHNIAPMPPLKRTDSTTSIGEAEDEIDLSLDIREQEIVVTGGGDGFVDGFNASR